MRRNYQNFIDYFLDDPQMLFIAGPRQSGKTTLARSQLQPERGDIYLNWDVPSDRKKILSGETAFIPARSNLQDPRPLLILDEVHKYASWKNLIKGFYDEFKDRTKIIVTGSGRLDIFSRGKDSLAGRYFLFHMWPFTCREVLNLSPQQNLMSFLTDPLKLNVAEGNSAEVWQQLCRTTGFPDPYVANDDRKYRIWSETYRNQIIREDVRQLTRLEKIDQLDQLVNILPSRVGASESILNLARDIQVSFDTLKKWLLVLEKFFVIFRLSPWTAKVSRAISKEKKSYLFDYGAIDDEGAKFENMVALELVSWCQGLREMGFGKFECFFIRDRNKNEVDFVITLKQKPILLIETKLTDITPSKSLLYFQKKLSVPAIQLVKKTGYLHITSNGSYPVGIFDAATWLSQLPIL